MTAKLKINDRPEEAVYPPAVNGDGHVLAVRASGEERRFQSTDTAENWLDDEFALGDSHQWIAWG